MELDTLRFLLAITRGIVHDRGVDAGERHARIAADKPESKQNQRLNEIVCARLEGEQRVWDEAEHLIGRLIAMMDEAP